MSSVTKFNLLKRFDRLGLLVIVCSSALVLANPLGNDNSGDDQTSSILLGSNESNDLVSRARFANNNHFSPLRWSQLLPTDDFLNSLRERIILVRPISRFPFTRKRSCQFNAGMSHNCDFKDLISASSARRLWGSSNMPGKKRSIVSNAMNPLDDDLSSLNRNGNKVTNNDDDGITSQLQHGSVQYDDESANIESNVQLQQQQQQQSTPIKRMHCISGLPGGDCENSFLGGESLGQDFLRPGGRNPGRR